MPQTVPFGFEFESLGEAPTRTLNGGPDGLSPITAQQVNDALITIVADVASLSSRLDAAEAGLAAARWRHITSGSQSGPGTIELAVPGGFERLRLSVTGDFVSEGTLLLRVNGDSSGNNHVTGRVAWDTVDPPNVQDVDWAEDTAWDLVQWSSVESNNVVVDIFPTNGNANPSFVAHGGRIGTDAQGHTVDFATGKYLGDVVVSQLDLFVSSPNEFANVAWWLEGYITP